MDTDGEAQESAAESAAENGENSQVIKPLPRDRGTLTLVRRVRSLEPALNDPIYLPAVVRYAELFVQFKRLAKQLRAEPRLTADNLPMLDSLRRVADSCSKHESVLGLTRAARDHLERPPDAVASFARQMSRLRATVDGESTEVEP
jgi:hypothetical protein